MRARVDDVGGDERVLRIFLVKIFADHARFDDRHAVIDKGGNDAVRIELEIIRLELFFLAEVDPHFVEFDPLLVQHQPNLLAAGGVRGVIEHEH